MARIIPVEINEMDVITIAGIKRRISRFTDVLGKKNHERYNDKIMQHNHKLPIENT